MGILREFALGAPVALRMNQEGIWNTLELCLKNCSQHQDGGQIIDVHWGFHYSNKDSLYPNAITYTYNVLAGGTCWGGSHSKNHAWPYFFGPTSCHTLSTRLEFGEALSKIVDISRSPTSATLPAAPEHKQTPALMGVDDFPRQRL